MPMLAHLRRWQHTVIRLLLSTLISVVLPLTLPPQYVHAAGVAIAGPLGSEAFGSQVVVLSNGNLVITDPLYDESGKTNIGAVYLYTPAGTQISKLTGSTNDDQVGSYGVVALNTGHYVISSPSWDNGSATDAGAVTWGSGTAGVAGEVTDTNSLVGSTANDTVGSGGVVVLSTGHYVVSSPNWDNGSATNAGAVTWGSGTVGVTGAVSAANSLVGSTASDQVGNGGVVALSNGTYVVRSPYWNGFRGAVTWGSATTGVAGAVTDTNSLVGSTASDQVGNGGVVALSNGTYLVSSPDWDNGSATDAGAVTWGSGTAGVAGAVSAANSLVGSTANDRVGNSGVVALSNGHYVVNSPSWSGGRGAVTWGSGTVGVTGEVADTNSLVGSTADDRVGNSGVVALSNGHYVVRSPDWSGGRGAVTWGSGTAGVAGAVSALNSLVGSTAGDRVGNGGVVALSTGTYVVRSPDWNGFRGAVTWGSATAGVAGAVSAANSLVGSTAGDTVGSSGVVALSNGTYAVSSPNWDNGSATNAGAVTWGSGTAGVAGAVSAANSLVGSTASDQVGNGGVVALSTGTYVVRSPDWNGFRGAVTWGSATGVTGEVTDTNSLVGSTVGDYVGSYGVVALSTGAYVVSSPTWDNGSATEAGAVTWGSGTAGVAGTVSAANSLVGSTANDQVGNYGVVALSNGNNNGNYVVSSPDWSGFRGAVTWGSGTVGVTGLVSAANSLVGSTVGDYVGSYGVVVLSNGNYVVSSSSWDNGTTVNVGAVTWGSGTAGVVGAVSATNSLVGSTADDNVGLGGVVALSNGTYVVRSPAWDTGSATDVGAVTWVAGGTAYGAVVNSSTSVVGAVSGRGYTLNMAHATDASVVWVGLPHENKVVQASLQNATAPTITSAAPFAGTYGTAYSHTFGASGDPKPTLVLTGTLPAGLTFDASTGTLSGIPQATGTFALTLTATSAAGTTTQNVTLTITRHLLYLPLLHKG